MCVRPTKSIASRERIVSTNIENLLAVRVVYTARRVAVSASKSRGRPSVCFYDLHFC